MVARSIACFASGTTAPTPEDCTELRFMTVGSSDELGAFKTPSLRRAASRAPYMDAGQITTLDAVLRHYDLAPEAQIGHSELRPRNFSDQEMAQLIDFLHALEPVATAAQ